MHPRVNGKAERCKASTTNQACLGASSETHGTSDSTASHNIVLNTLLASILRVMHKLISGESGGSCASIQVAISDILTD